MSVVSLPVTMVLSLLFYGSVNYRILAEEHYLLLTVITQPLRALLFLLVSKRLRERSLRLSDKEWLIMISLLLLTVIMMISASNLIFIDIFRAVDISVTVYCIILFLLVLFYLFTDITSKNKEKESDRFQIMMLENQLANNKQILEAQEELYRIRHDLKHLLNSHSFSDEDDEDIRRLLEEYRQEVQDTYVPIKTPSESLNFVLNIKRQEALEKKIDFQSIINVAEEIQIDDIDLYLIMANLLDNAIRHIGLDRHIQLEFIVRNKEIRVRITNSHDRKVLDKNNNVIYFHNDGHGYGIQTVRLLLEKYDGGLLLDETESTFIAMMLLPNIKITNSTLPA